MQEQVPGQDAKRAVVVPVPDLEGNLLDQLLAASTALTLKQQAPDGFEFRQRYVVSGANMVLFTEQKGLFVNDILPGPWRRGELRVLDGQGSVWLYVRKQPALLASRAVVLDHHSLAMAAVVRESSWPGRDYGLYSAGGDRVGGLSATGRLPMKFRLCYDGEPVGDLERRWGDIGEGNLALRQFTLNWKGDLPLDARKAFLAGALLMIWYYAPAPRRRRGPAWRVAD
ncbi:MAG: hypothetical protein KA419_17595 [Acidobacteria bacterium]|nr:hypothetical protein [Acidobacteriota bacterium]